ncbi:RdgB/HAM1 family non-canonical purine NTP pyrophosphatase [bacterium]|nr:RdgB/HAM1 family non-canonical purine NTP pyrophosphatase [bacterium]
MKIIFASGNLGKLREAGEIFKGFEIVPISAFPTWIAPVETGSTFLQNAVIKAEAAAAAAEGHIVLADDSGLVVPALDGAPGIFSARFSAEGTDIANRKKLLVELSKIGDRSAYFLCTAVLIFPDKTVIATEGRCYGRIIKSERGNNGFGYDPIFMPDGYDKTLAELSEEDKNAISHRGKAFRKLIGAADLHGIS